MTLSGESLAFILGLISLAGALWRIFSAIASMKDQLRTDIRDVRENLQMKDMTLENLQDKQALAFNGLKERIDHSIIRLKAENNELKIRVASIEGYLVKTTNFEVRNHDSQGTL